MKVYIVTVIDDLDGSETIEHIFSTKELAKKYIEKCKNLVQNELYQMRIIEDDLITNFNQIL